MEVACAASSQSGYPSMPAKALAEQPDVMIGLAPRLLMHLLGPATFMIGCALYEADESRVKRQSRTPLTSIP